MSLQDALTTQLFKLDESGRRLVFPNGVLGRGYVLPDEAAEARLRRALMWIMIGAIVIGVAVSQIIVLALGDPGQWPSAAWAGIGAALVAIALGYRAIVGRLVRGLASTSARLSMLEAIERQAKALPRWYLWFMAGTGVLLGLGSIGMALSAGSTPERLMGVAGALLFAMVLLQAVYGLSRGRGSSGGASR